MTRLFLGFVGIVLLTSNAVAEAAPADEEKQRLVVELMELTETEQLRQQMKQMFAQEILAGMSLEQPNLPQAAVEAVTEVVNEQWDAMEPDRLAFTAGVYIKHFSADDLRGLLAFYRSPLGQRTLNVMPQILQETTEWTLQTWLPTLPDMMAEVVKRTKVDQNADDKGT